MFNLRFSFLTEFPNLHYPIYEVFNILTKTKQPIVALLNVAAQNQTDDYIHLLVQALLYGKELKGDLRLVICLQKKHTQLTAFILLILFI